MAQLTLLATPVERFALRPYQQDFLAELYQALREGKLKIACVAPTGSGKTVLMAQIAEHAVQRGRRVLILVHLDVLVGQTFEKMRAFGLHHDTGFIKAGWPEARDAQIQIGSVQTMGRRRWWRDHPFDVILFDEAHTTLFSRVGQALRYETHPDSIMLGFTATPYRLGKAQPQLGDHLDHLVSAPTPRRLQDMGMLAPMRYFGLSAGDQADLTGVRTVAGDYSEADLKNACDRPHLVQRIVEEWHRLTPGKRTIAFCVGVDHAHHVAQAFDRSGVPSGVVTGDTPIDERRRLYDALGRGELLVLTSCNVISIGFDEPRVEVGLLLRPTKSLALHHQQIGRVMRIATGKTHGVILDQAGNLLRLGFPEDVDRYALAKAVDTNNGPGECPKKQCPTCNSIINVFETVCPSCGHQFESTAIEIDADLVELEPDSKQAKTEAGQRSRFQTLLKTAFRKGYDPAWASVQFKQKYGLKPKKTWAQGAIFGADPTEADYQAYLTALRTVAQAKHKHENWVLEQFMTEFGKQNGPAMRFVCDAVVYPMLNRVADDLMNRFN